MENINIIPFQAIEGVPVAQIGNRFRPTALPVEWGCNDQKTVFWFVYEGSKRGKLTVDTENMTETLTEVV